MGADKGASWTASVSQQKVVCNDRCATLQPLNGLLAQNPSQNLTSSISGGSLDAAEGTECVICLTNPRDTVVLHCRHVCLCSTCAAVTSSTWSFQCPVCRG